MSRWENQFQNHQIHSIINELIDLLNIAQNDVNADEEVEKRRLVKVINYHKDVLQQVDPEVLPYNILDGLNNTLRHENVINQVRSYSSNRNISHLNTANNYINNNLSGLSQLLAFAKKTSSEKPIRGLEKAVDDFCKTIDSKKESLKDEMKKILESGLKQETRLNELATSIDNKKKETDNLISSWQQQFSDAQNQRNESFAKDQNSRSSSYDLWSKNTSAEATKFIQDLIAESRGNLDTEQTVFKKRISDYIDDANKKHKSICELYGLAADDSVAGGYQQNATDEKKQANFWRWGTIIFIGLTVLWTAFSYLSGLALIQHWLGLNIDQVTTPSLYDLFRALSVTGVLLFGAAYSAKQSSIHRKNEKKTRWFALEVKAIDPFIASLNETDRIALKNELSKKLFGNNDFSDDKDHGMIDEHAFTTIVKSFAEVVKIAKK